MKIESKIIKNNKKEKEEEFEERNKPNQYL